jgi:hypothetical protein
LRLKPGDDGFGLVARPSDRGPARDDRSVVAHTDPPTFHVVTARMQDEEERSAGTDVYLVGVVPTHENAIVPTAEFATPDIATFYVLLASFDGADADGHAVLLHLDRLYGDQFGAIGVGRRQSLQCIYECNFPGKGALQKVSSHNEDKQRTFLHVQISILNVLCYLLYYKSQMSAASPSFCQFLPKTRV